MRRLLFLLIVLLCAPHAALANAPATLPVQGHLSDGSGGAINDVFAVTFTLYSDAEGSSSVWSEEVPVNFVEGYFTVYLGSTSALDLVTFRDNDGLYLGVKVADDEEMTPFALGSAPFAGYAQYAGFAADITDAAKVQIVGDVAVQLDNDGKVHDKYTDAEAIAAVTNALATDTTTLEASLGATDDSNTLNHARYTDAEAVAALASHTENASAHHDKYTDAEAIAAVTGGDATFSGDVAVGGNLAAAGQLSAQSGKIRRDFFTFSNTDSNATPIHIKTNIPIKTNIMFRLHLEGYNYGAARAINSDAVGYTYTTSNCTINTQINNYASGVSLSQYCSSDGFVVLKLDYASGYYIGFGVSAWFTNPTGAGFDISATAVRQDANL